MSRESYTWLALVVGCLVSMIISVTVSVRESEQRRQEAAKLGQRTVCTVINRMHEAHVRQGNDEVAQAWSDMAATFGCK